MLHCWPRSLWWKQRNRVKLHEADSGSSGRCLRRCGLELPHASLRLLLFSLLLSTAVAIVDNEIPFISSRRGTLIASRQAIGATINVTSKMFPVCDILPNSATFFVISTCCDGTLTYSPTVHSLYDRGRQHIMTLPAAPTKRQLGVQMKQANGTCAALVLCYSGTAGNPLPEDTNLSVFTNQVILHATWARSQREAYGDFSYELVVGTTREQVADGCTVSQLLHTTRKPRQKRQILNNGGQGAQAIVVYRQPSCDSPRFCSANINLAHFGLLPNREYHVNVFIAFHGVRLAYSASSFCFSIGQSCTISSSIPTSSTSVSTSTSSTTAVSTYERGKLTSQFSDVVLTELRQGGPKSALFTTFALSLPASSGLHVALYIYSCTNSTRGTVTVYQRNAVGRSHLGNQERRFASFVLATKASKDLVRVMYVPKEPNVTDLPLLRLNALYYDNSSRHKLPPLANRTLLRVSGASAGGQCAVTLDLAFNCSSRNLQCSELNEQNVYYRLLRTPHSSRVPSCVPTSSSSGKPLDSKALKLLPVARVSGPGGKRGRNGKAYRLWNYQATLSVEAGARRRYYVQLFWRVISTDSFIPFSESTFRLGRDCQVPAGGWRAKRKVA